jgi:hypothetical protein
LERGKLQKRLKAWMFMLGFPSSSPWDDPGRILAQCELEAALERMVIRWQSNHLRRFKAPREPLLVLRCRDVFRLARRESVPW